MILFICRFQAKPQQQAERSKKRLQKQEKRGYRQTHEVKQNESERIAKQNDYSSNNNKQHIKGRKRKKMYSANEVVTELSDYR